VVEYQKPGASQFQSPALKLMNHNNPGMLAIVVRGSLPNPSLEGGFELLLLFLFSRFSSSAIHAAI
ncbi:hypothetical protein Loak_0032, partial [Legionella oakridgensis]